MILTRLIESENSVLDPTAWPGVLAKGDESGPKWSRSGLREERRKRRRCHFAQKCVKVTNSVLLRTWSAQVMTRLKLVPKVVILSKSDIPAILVILSKGDIPDVLAALTPALTSRPL